MGASSGSRRPPSSNQGGARKGSFQVKSVNDAWAAQVSKALAKTDKGPGPGLTQDVWGGEPSYSESYMTRRKLCEGPVRVQGLGGVPLRLATVIYNVCCDAYEYWRPPNGPWTMALVSAPAASDYYHAAEQDEVQVILRGGLRGELTWRVAVPSRGAYRPDAIAPYLAREVRTRIDTWVWADADQWERVGCGVSLADAAPDLITPVIGYRFWLVNRESGLGTVSGYQHWYGAEMHATCTVVPGPSHNPPHPECGCGVHVHHSLEANRAYREKFRRPSVEMEPAVFGVCEVTGEMEVYHGGVRAAHARVLALNDKVWAERFDVPFAINDDDLIAIGEQHGAPVPVSMRPPDHAMDTRGMWGSLVSDASRKERWKPPGDGTGPHELSRKCGKDYRDAQFVKGNARIIKGITS